MLTELGRGTPAVQEGSSFSRGAVSLIDCQMPNGCQVGYCRHEVQASGCPAKAQTFTSNTIHRSN